MGKAGVKTNLFSPDNITATPQELSVMAGMAKDIFVQSVNNPVDLHDRESTENAILEYFHNCERRGIRPGNLGLYAALGLSKQDVSAAINGKSKAKISPECIDLLKKAIRAMGAYREMLVTSGKINPVSYIYMSKNYDGLSDVTQIEISADTRQEARLTPEQIAKQIEQDIPIDADFVEN